MATVYSSDHDRIEITNRSVVLTDSLNDEWNTLDDFMMCHNPKRVSLDATETWMSEDDFDLFHLEEDPILQPMEVETTFSEQFEQRRQQLAASMRASKMSRQCLKMQQEFKQRNQLHKVLKDIETSTQQVIKHLEIDQPETTTKDEKSV